MNVVKKEKMNKRESSIEITKEEFKKIGYQLIDSVSEFIDGISEKPVTTGKSPKELQNLLGNLPLPVYLPLWEWRYVLRS